MGMISKLVDKMFFVPPAVLRKPIEVSMEEVISYKDKLVQEKKFVPATTEALVEEYVYDKFNGMLDNTALEVWYQPWKMNYLVRGMTIEEYLSTNK